MNLAEGHQVMVFVHARKETVKSAEKLKEMAQTESLMEDFSCIDHPQYDAFRREIATSKNKEMKQLFDAGIGIHHAGMLRSDRNMMERMFEANCLKVCHVMISPCSSLTYSMSQVLVCTATLAWGVNLPAHAVVIKGTQVYDATKGSFVDLSILDVLQVSPFLKRYIEKHNGVWLDGHRFSVELVDPDTRPAVLATFALRQISWTTTSVQF